MIRALAVLLLFLANAASAVTLSIPNGSVTLSSSGSISGSTEEILPVLGFPDEIYRSSISGSWSPAGFVSGSISYNNTINQCCMNGNVYQTAETGTGNFSGTLNLDTGAYRVVFTGDEPGILSGVDPQLVRLKIQKRHEIVQDILKNTFCGSLGDSLEQAGCALSQVVRQREQPGQSTNTDLRDAEYMLRNYIGGQVLKRTIDGESIPQQFNDLAGEVVLQNPAATAGYNIKKAVDEFLGRGDVNRAQPNNPNSPPGGFDASVEGFRNGFDGLTLDQAVGNGLIDDTPQNQPVTPLQKPAGTSSQRDVFLENVDGTKIYGFDPLTGVTYDYAVLVGPGISGFGASAVAESLALPADFKLTISDLFGNSLMLALGETAGAAQLLSAFGTTVLYDFSVFAETATGPTDYLLLLEFAEDGNLLMGRSARVPGLDSSPVPLPASLPALLAGLGMLGLAGIRRAALSAKGGPAKPAFQSR